MDHGIEENSSEIARDPVRLARWAGHRFVLSVSQEEDLQRTLNEEECRKYNISELEKKFCAMENVLMRALGICLFVRNNMEQEFYAAFKEELLKVVEERFTSLGTLNHARNIDKALDQYLEDLRSETPWAFSNTYLKRVYPHTSNAQDLFLSGIPVKHAMMYAMDYYNLAFDNYNQLIADDNRLT